MHVQRGHCQCSKAQGTHYWCSNIKLGTRPCSKAQQTNKGQLAVCKRNTILGTHGVQRRIKRNTCSKTRIKEHIISVQGA
jgi:hypothetical protein